MLLVNKKCSQKFLNTISHRDHGRHVFHVAINKVVRFQEACSTMDTNTIGYRVKVVICYGDRVLPANSGQELQQEFKDFTLYPKFIASIPRIRNVEIVHVNKYAEEKTYRVGQHWPALLSGREIEEPGNQLIYWMDFCVRILCPWLALPSSLRARKKCGYTEKPLVMGAFNVLSGVDMLRVFKTRI
jgi:hypothetical protein